MIFRFYKERRNLFPIIFILAIIALQAIPVWALQNSPSHSVGLSGGPIFVIAITPDNSTAVYVGTGSGIFKSVYGKDIWTPVNEGLASTYVYDIVPTPVTPTIIYATTKEGIYETSDGGEKWTSVGLKDYQTYSLAIHPDTTNYLAAGTTEGVFTSTDGGSSWTKEPTGPSYVYSVALAEDNASTLYAGSFGEGVYKSTDFGLTWTNTGIESEYIYHIVVNPSTTDILYAGTHKGIYKSTNSGKSWSSISADFSDVPVYDIAIVPSRPSRLYAATDKGAFRTTNNGSSWNIKNNGIATDGKEGPFVREIAVDPNDSSTLYAGAYSGNIYDVDIYKSTNSGSTWEQINRELSNTIVYSLSFDTENTDVAYAGTGTLGVIKSINNGLSWSESNEGLTNYYVRAVTIDPDSSDVYAGTYSGLFISTDSATEWTEASPNYEIYSIGINSLASENLYIGTNSGVFMSTDEGETWASMNNNLTNPNILCMVFHPEDSEIMYVGTRGDGIFKSTSGGENWKPVSEGLDYLDILSLAIDPVNSDTLYAGTRRGGIYKSSNSGETWEFTLPAIDDFTINSIAINPDDPNIVFAGMKSRGLYRSTDGGLTWGVCFQEISDETVYDVVLDPDDSQTVLVAIEGDIKIFTFNTPPYAPDSPAPPDGAVNQPVTTILNWTCLDPDASDSLSYKVFFGTNKNPDINTPVEVTNAEYDPGMLQLNQTYYWKVLAVDGHNAETEGDIWEFSTIISNPPLTPSNPLPQDGSENQSILTSLSWTGGDTDNGDVVVYDVFLGTKETPPLTKKDVEETTYTPLRPLRPLTTYYWKIVSRDNHGLETESAVWSFTTGLVPDECLVQSILGKNASILQSLRRIRDEFLIKSELGRKLVDFYYALSPVSIFILKQNLGLKIKSLKIFSKNFPLIQRSRKKEELKISPTIFHGIQNSLDLYAKKASPSKSEFVLLSKPQIIHEPISVSKEKNGKR